MNYLLRKIIQPSWRLVIIQNGKIGSLEGLILLGPSYRVEMMYSLHMLIEPEI